MSERLNFGRIACFSSLSAHRLDERHRYAIVANAPPIDIPPSLCIA
ncbi:MAG: hypothetical protein RMK18_09465 [Armatimonadota bacterium]|nr:hypothetical protein [Armatimonadota bacterium]MCX7778045.1 hypothetical protein [Armatimonadota bacterium]MDW8026071.1 hypothetical protein [Armatimonadota bacterium]